MLIAIDCGHNCPPDTGASGNGFLEDKLTLEVGSLCAVLLKKAGHSVLMVSPAKASTVNDSLNQRVRLANNSKADLYVSIHFNAFSNPSAQGTEVFVHNAKSTAKLQADRVCNNLCELGFRRRGVKFASFAVLRNTNMPAILIEVCFLTSSRDMQLFDAQKAASAIASGILGTANIKSAKCATGDTPRGHFREKITLNVIQSTLLKPSAEQSSSIPFNLMAPIPPGKYDCELVGEEEEHYLIKYEGKEWFIYTEHCEINA